MTSHLQIHCQKRTPSNTQLLRHFRAMGTTRNKTARSA
jgi:hypothetical protein